MTDFIGVPWWGWFIIAFELQVYAISVLLIWTYRKTFIADFLASFKSETAPEAPRVE